MDWPEAIVSGVVVVLGVVAAHYLEQRAATTRQIREDALELSHLLTQLPGGYLDPEVDTSIGSAWWELRQRVFELLSRLRVSVRGRRLRRGDDVSAALDRISATVGAADMAMIVDGNRIPRAAALDFTSQDLMRALWPKSSKTLYEELKVVQARWNLGMPAHIPDENTEEDPLRWWSRMPRWRPWK